MKPLRVLITNLAMWSRSGTETHARDLAVGLLRREHRPMLYTPRVGDIARETEIAGVEVVDDLKKLSQPPDVIHGHHNITTMIAALHFPQVPAVFVCHDKFAWHDAPPRFSTIRRYVAVDWITHDRLVEQHSIPEEMVSIIGNSVDLERFKPRSPLPPQPQRALLFSNYANSNTHLQAVREACRQTSIELDVRGAGVNNVCDHPETILGNYDLVFGKARCAMEAMAVGAAVVLCGSEGCGPMVTTPDFSYLRGHNFGHYLLKDAVTAENLVKQIEHYNADEATRVAALAREHLTLDLMVEQWIKLYQQILAEKPAIPLRAENMELEQVAQFLISLDPVLLGIYPRDSKIRALEGEIRELQGKIAQYEAAEQARLQQKPSRFPWPWQK